MTLYFASYWAHFLGPFSRNLLICLALPFLADSFERLITAQLRGNCTLCIDQAILRGPSHFSPGATGAWDLGSFPT